MYKSDGAEAYAAEFQQKTANWMSRTLHKESVQFLVVI